MYLIFFFGGEEGEKLSLEAKEGNRNDLKFALKESGFSKYDSVRSTDIF